MLLSASSVGASAVLSDEPWNLVIGISCGLAAGLWAGFCVDGIRFENKRMKSRLAAATQLPDILLFRIVAPGFAFSQYIGKPGVACYIGAFVAAGICWLWRAPKWREKQWIRQHAPLLKRICANNFEGLQKADPDIQRQAKKLMKDLKEYD